MQTATVIASENFYAALWLSALWLASTNAAIDIFPPEFAEIAAQLFERCRPLAKA